jgi:hypothetical protein
VLETLPEGFTVSLEDVVEGVTKPLLWFFFFSLSLASAFAQSIAIKLTLHQLI